MVDTLVFNSISSQLHAFLLRSSPKTSLMRRVQWEQESKREMWGSWQCINNENKGDKNISKIGPAKPEWFTSTWIHAYIAWVEHMRSRHLIGTHDRHLAFMKLGDHSLAWNVRWRHFIILHMYRNDLYYEFGVLLYAHKCRHNYCEV